MAVEIAIFPLSTVLFPHMPMALHVFEERYRRMLADCSEAGRSFGVVAIREGSEVGPGAVPYEVGTLAQIRSVRRLPDGRSHLLIEGASRFRVEAFLRGRPYHHGSVTYLQDIPLSADDAPALTAELVRSYGRYLGVPGDARPEPELPDEPELLAYLVAASLQVDVARRQQLLELDRTEDRIRACLALLRREQRFLDQHLTHRARAGAVSLN